MVHEDPVLVDVRRGILFAAHGCCVMLGDTCQDVLSAIGPPHAVFYKQENKMRIHAAREASCEDSAASPDYFWNYFALGIDLLFDGYAHTVRKIVLHLNYPDHDDFNDYERCHFYLYGADRRARAARDSTGGIWCFPPSVPAAAAKGTLSACTNAIRDAMQPAELAEEDGSGGAFVITPFTTWDVIRGHLGEPAEKPVVLARGASTSPFGRTLYYGYPSVIFEVMRNNHLASVTIYDGP